jgi:hypothetical protein
MMHKQVITTSLTLGITKNSICSPLSRNEQEVGFVMKALPDLQMIVPKRYSSFIFFVVNTVTSQLEQHICFLPHGISEIRLCYSEEDEGWLLVAGGQELMVMKLEFAEKGEVVQPYVIDNAELGDKGIVHAWCKEHVCHIIFSVADLAEEGLTNIYLARWDTRENHYKNMQLIGQADVVRTSIFPGGFWLFRCGHGVAGTENMATSSGQEEAWSLSVSTYTRSGERLSQQEIDGVAIPVRNDSLAVEDFFDRLACTIQIADGLFVDVDGRAECVTALGLQDISMGVIFSETFQGGLFLVGTNGAIVQGTRDRIGTRVSLCRCGDVAVGTDIWDGRRRMWYWDFSVQAGLKIFGYLPDELKRATLVADETRKGELTRFWSVEEYAQGIRIVCWGMGKKQEGKVREFKEVDSVWHEGIRLFEVRPLAHSQQSEVQGIMAVENGVVVLGISREEKMEMVLVELNK